MQKQKKSVKDLIPPEGLFDARKLGIPRMLILGLQHMFAMFGATVLVPLILVNQYELPMSIQTTLFCAGIGTLLFHLLTKFKVPAFLGSSFAFLGGFSAVSQLDEGIFVGMTGEQKLPYALGGVVVAGLLYLVFALIIKLVGVKRVMRFLPPVVTGPIIISIGLILASSAVSNASGCWWLAALSLLVIIGCNIWGKGMIKIIPILMGVVVPYALVLILSLCGVISPDSGAYVNLEAVKTAQVVGLQQFMLPKFNLTAILVMAPIAIATMMEHVGDISAISATTKKNFVQDPGLHRTLLGDGLATSLSAMIGGPANTTYGENTGVLALSKVYDPSRLCHYPLLQPHVCADHSLHPLRYHRRRFLHPLRHDLRHRRPQRGGKPGRPFQEPQRHHCGSDPGQRPWLLRRPDLHHRYHHRYPDQLSHCCDFGHRPECDPSRQGLSVQR